MSPFNFSADGRVLVSDGPIVVFSNGLPFDVAGNLVIAQDAPVLSTEQGLPRSASGAIVVTQLPGITTWSQGLLRDAASGAIVASENAASVWDNGVPLDSSGALAVSGLWDPSKLFESGEPGALFDVSDISTLFQDSAGTIPAAVGSPVGMMMDVSGNGNHATQTAAINRPVLQRDTNGLLCLTFNGTNSWMAVSQLDMSNISNVSTSLGMRALGSTIANIVVELSTDVNSNNGSFYVTMPHANPWNNVGCASRGSAQTSGLYNVDPFPTTVVATSLCSISAPLLNLRINNSSVFSNSLSQGSGNYGSYPFYIGGRVSSSSLWFRGNLYGVVVRGKLSSNIEVTATESWLNARTGAY